MSWLQPLTCCMKSCPDAFSPSLLFPAFLRPVSPPLPATQTKISCMLCSMAIPCEPGKSGMRLAASAPNCSCPEHTCCISLRDAGAKRKGIGPRGGRATAAAGYKRDAVRGAQNIHFGEWSFRIVAPSPAVTKHWPQTQPASLRAGVWRGSRTGTAEGKR